MFSNLSDALPQAAGGTVRVLAVSGEQALAGAPDVPTVAECGYPEFNTLTWNGLMAPAGTPPVIVDKIAEEMAAAVKEPSPSACYRRRSARQHARRVQGDARARRRVLGGAVEVAGVKQ